MARIADLLAAGPTFSLEFMPPRTDEMLRQFEKSLEELKALDPSFCSVTYGAGGSTRERTLDAVLHVHHGTDLVAMPHLTCAGHTRRELTELLGRYRDEGLENVLALAGDPPREGPVTGDFTYAVELIELVREVGDFCIGVAAFPELHPRSADEGSDRRHLAAKLAVADFAITQFFWSVESFLRLRDALDALGVTTPVIPSLFPILNAATARRFTAINGAAWPSWLEERLAPFEDDAAAVRAIGVEVATELGADLLAAGVPGLHVYTMNRSASVLEIWDNLDLASRR